MGIFDNLFGSSQDYEQRIEQKRFAQEEREQAIKDAQRREQENLPIFQVGTTEDSRVTLRIGNYGAWVTMSDSGVDQLISLLTAAKAQYGDYQANEEDDEE